MRLRKQQGEWLYQIARKCGFTPAEVLAVNPGLDADRLQPGQQLRLPAP